MNKKEEIKTIVKKIDIGKITGHLEKNPTSKTLKEIIKYSKKTLDSNEEKKIFKLGTDLAYELDIIANKTDYVKDEAEKKYWLEISRELFENTIGIKDKK